VPARRCFWSPGFALVGPLAAGRSRMDELQNCFLFMLAIMALA